MTATKAYEEAIEFIAAGSNTEQVASFQPSEEARERFWDLIDREKRDGLNAEETAELETALQLEHLMRLAKARAFQRLQQNYQTAPIGEK